MKSGENFSTIGLLFKDAEKAEDLTDRIKKASEHFKTIAQIEEEALNGLYKVVSI